MENENQDIQSQTNPQPQQSMQPSSQPVAQQTPISGTNVVADVQNTVNQAEVLSKSSKKPFIIMIIAIILLIIVGVAAYFMLAGSSKTEPAKELTNMEQQDAVQEQTIDDPDVQALDQELSSLDNDLKDVDQGLNDSPEDLTQ